MSKNKLLQIGFIVLDILIWVWVGWCISQVFPKSPPEPKIELKTDLVIVDGAFLKAITSPVNIYFGTPIVRVLTAYNPVESQTDNTPCIAASGLNICETKKKIFASNEFEFGQKVLIDGEVWECQDRTNSRYNFRIDLLMFDYQEAREFGRQIKEIILLN